MGAIAQAFAAWPEITAFPFGAVDAEAPPQLRALLVVAHPDDESECAALIYRITHELGGIVDQIVVTNGEGGHNYAAPAASYYGLPLHKEEGRAHLIRVRRKEQLRASRTLGIRHTYFLGQQDTGVVSDAGEALEAWDLALVNRKITGAIRRGNYDIVLVLLPTPETHGHHKAVALLALEAIENLPPAQRPAVIGARTGEPGTFSALPGFPLTRTTGAAPVWSFDRHTPLRCHPALDHSIIVNWAVSEHKSQGFFQMESSHRSHEHFWLFEAGGEASRARWNEFLKRLGA